MSRSNVDFPSSCLWLNLESLEACCSRCVAVPSSDEWYIRSGADRLKILQSVLDVREQMATARRLHLGLTIEDEYQDNGMMIIRRGLDPIGEEDEEGEEAATSRIKGAHNESRVESIGQRKNGGEKQEVVRVLNGTDDALAGENVTLRRRLEESERRLSRLVKVRASVLLLLYCFVLQCDLFVC